MTHKQKVLALLRDGRPHTHHELYRLGCVAHSRVADLRGDGYTINCWRDGELSMYQLVGSLGEPSPNQHVDGQEPSGDVQDGDRSPSETSDTPAVSNPSTVGCAPVSLTLFDVAA